MQVAAEGWEGMGGEVREKNQSYCLLCLGVLVGVYNHNMVNSVRAVILWEEAVSLCRRCCWYK